MVAEDNDRLAAACAALRFCSCCRLRTIFSESGPRSSDVAELHEDGVAARPMALGIDHAGGARDVLPCGEVAMEIADGDDTLRLLSGGRRWPRDDGERQRIAARNDVLQAGARCERLP